MKQTDVQRKVAAATGLLWPKRNDQDTDAPASLLLVTKGQAVRVLSLGRKGKLPSATVFIDGGDVGTGDSESIHLQVLVHPEG